MGGPSVRSFLATFAHFATRFAPANAPINASLPPTHTRIAAILDNAFADSAASWSSEHLPSRLAFDGSFFWSNGTDES